MKLTESLVFFGTRPSITINRLTLFLVDEIVNSNILLRLQGIKWEVVTEVVTDSFNWICW